MVSTTQRQVPEDKLKYFYLDRGLTDSEIAEKLECTKQAVYLARKKFGVNSITQRERNTKLISITKRQEDIIRGSLLGDAYLSPEGEIDIQHGPKQFGYLLWLFKNLQPYFGEIRNARTCRRIRSCSHNFGVKLRQEFYPKGKKIVTYDILEKLTPLSIAVWFMDDGQVLPSGKQARLSTCDFSEEEHKLMCDYFKQRWGIVANIGKNGKYKQLTFNREDTLKLINLIRIHVPAEMRYKIRPASGISLYLSGGMEFKKNLGAGWREWISEELKELNIDAIDPVKSEPTDTNATPIQHNLTDLKIQGKLDVVRSIVRDVLFRKDMLAIQLSDGMIVYYDESVRKGAGTLAEAWESFREGKPVYLVSDFPIKEIPTWLIGETTAIFTSFRDLLSYLKNTDTIDKDMKEALRLKAEVFSGI